MNEATAMRRCLALQLVIALLAGCDRWQSKISDADFQDLKASNPGMTQKCLDEVRYGGIGAWRPDDPDCYEMMPAQHWSGLWERGWEWTNFCPDPATECDWMAKRGIWLTFTKNAYRGSRVPDGTYRVEFIGRRSKVRGTFGHMGSYDYLMAVDRLTLIKEIEAPPKK